LVGQVRFSHAEQRLQHPVRQIGRPMSSASEIQPQAYQANARFFRVLGDATRLAIITHLLTRPHTVSELVVKLGAPQSRVSNHLACLRWCGFVTTERHGQKVIYTIADPRLGSVLALGDEFTDGHQARLSACRRIGPDWI
jgi:DNA-binding transcriptional ArsR family regulator